MKTSLLSAFCIGTLLTLTACTKEDTPADLHKQQIVAHTSVTGYEKRILSLSLNAQGAGTLSADERYTLFLGNSQQQHTPLQMGTSQTYYWGDIVGAEPTTDVYACHPAVANGQQGSTLLWTTHGGEDRQSNDLLLMTQKTIKTYQPINVIFKHAMHKLIVHLKAGSGVDAEQLKQVALQLKNVKTSCNVQLATGDITPVGDGQTLSRMGDTSSFLLPPQSTEGLKLAFDFKNGKVVEIAFPTQTTLHKVINRLESGKALQVNYTINKKNKVEFTGATVVGWEQGDEINAEIDV